MKIAIIGGGIAGCATGILLQTLGYEVHVYERSRGMPDHNNGAGVVLPLELIQKCIALNLLDKDIPFLSVNSRAFFIKDKDVAEQSRKFWDQEIHMVTLNWFHIYENLRKRIHPERYHASTEVRDIKRHLGTYVIETSQGLKQADFIIATDGHYSTIRQKVMPQATPQFSGYVAWRGVVEIDPHEQAIFDAHIPYYMFKDGHILMYQIPDIHHHSSGKIVLNWLFYQIESLGHLPGLLKDKDQKQHVGSIPPGYLSNKSRLYLQNLITHSLPPNLATIINRTPNPFIQLIYDFQLKPYQDPRLIFIGDAGFTVRPHSVSGVLNAFKSSFALVEMIKDNPHATFEEIIVLWKKHYTLHASDEVNKARVMGTNLVTNPPDWNEFNQERTTQWWNGIMAGTQWYAEKISKHSIFKPVPGREDEQNDTKIMPKL